MLCYYALFSNWFLFFATTYKELSLSSATVVLIHCPVETQLAEKGAGVWLMRFALCCRCSYIIRNWGMQCLLLASPVVVVLAVKACAASLVSCSWLEFDMDIYKKGTSFSRLHTHPCISLLITCTLHSLQMLYSWIYQNLISSSVLRVECYFSSWFHFPSCWHSFIPVIPTEIFQVPIY